MKIHQQRVPIISPLDRDYFRSAPNTGLSADKFADEYDSNAALSSLGADMSRSLMNGQSDVQVTKISDAVDSLGFTIIGERELYRS